MDAAGQHIKGPAKVLSPTLTTKQSKTTNMQRTIDEMRQHIGRLKGDLETERTKNKQMHRDKVAEIKHARENSQTDKDQALEMLQAKLEHQKQLEIQKAKEAVTKEKDQEIRQLHKYHEEEMKALKSHLSAEKQDAINVALEMQKHMLSGDRQTPQSNSVLVIKLQREVKQLKEEIEEKMKVKVDEEKLQLAESVKLKEVHVTEINKLKKELCEKHEIEISGLKKEIERLSVKREHSNVPNDLLSHSNISNDLLSHSNVPNDLESHSSLPNNVKNEQLHSNIEVINPPDNTNSIKAYNVDRIDKNNVLISDTKSNNLNRSNMELVSSSPHQDVNNGTSVTESSHQVAPLNNLVNSPSVNQDDQHTRLHDESRDKERQLQKKVTDLTTQLNKLEKRSLVLKTENESLKKKSEDQKTSEDKIRKLKKRNAELAAIARRLEEKAKQLQVENTKRRESLDTDRRSKFRTREQLDNKHHDKDRELELELLKQKCQFLSAQLTKSSIIQQEVPSVEKEELENIIKKAAKERLKLERQILVPLNQNSEAELKKIKTLEETNQALQGEVERLITVAAGSEKLEIEVTQRRIECENLNTQIEASRQRCRTLEGELQETIEKNTQLTIQNSDLQQRISQLDKVNEECQQLRTSLSQVQQECDSANIQVNELTDRVTTLQQDIQTLRNEVLEKQLNEVKQTETLTETLDRLHEREGKITMLQQQQHSSELQHQGTITGLQSKLHELERKYAMQAQQQNQLTQEMDDLRREAENARLRTETSPQIMNSLNREQVIDLEDIQVQEDSEQQQVSDDLQHKVTDQQQVSDDLQHKVTYHPVQQTEGNQGDGPVTNGDSINTSGNGLGKKLERGSTMDEIDSLDSSYEEEVETAREVKPVQLLQKQTENIVQQEQLNDSLEQVTGEDNIENRSEGSMNRSEDIMNQFESTMVTNSEGDVMKPSENRDQPEDIHRLPPQDIVDIEILLDTKDKRNAYIQGVLSGSSPQHGDGQNKVHVMDNLDNTWFNEDSELQNLSRKIDELSTYSDDSDEDKVDILEDNIVRSDEDNNNKVMMKSSDDMMSLSMDGSMYMKKSPFQVYIAKYQYDPQQFSPNENPDAELSLSVGDYIFVYGEMDEDGFFEGELMDGRRGLVPSNFVEKVPDEELEEFHSNLGLHHRDDTSSMTASIQHDLEFNSSDENQEKFNIGRNAINPPRPRSKVNGQNVVRENQQNTVAMEMRNKYKVTEVTYSGVAAPRGLKVDRELHNSVLISWQPPTNITDIQSYHVYVNQQLKTSVKSTERTKALLEGINFKQSHRISVRAVSPRGESTDAVCILTIGKDAPLAPSDLTVTSITSVSAVITWVPSNSNHGHMLSINGQDIKLIQSGCPECIVSGLQADTNYKVTITTSVDESTIAVHKAVTANFRTLEGGIPDAPLDVQVESGPQEGTLLVTWLPVTITTSGKSNGAKVTGYSIYVDGQKVQEMASPTGDHTVLSSRNLTSLLAVPQSLTVRTMAIDSTESPDSQPAQITANIVDELTKSLNNLPTAQLSQHALQIYPQYETDDQKLNNNKSIDPQLLSNHESLSNHMPLINEKSVNNNTNITLTSVEPVVTPAPERRSSTQRSKRSLEEELIEEGVTPAEDLGDSELSDIAEVDEEDDTPRTQMHLGKDVAPRKTSSPRVPSPMATRNIQAATVDRSPRLVPTKIVSAGQMMAPHVAFRPVQEDEIDRSSDHSNINNNMSVPHIQITKDSSGSFSDDVSPEKQPSIGYDDSRQRRPKSVPGDRNYRGSQGDQSQQINNDRSGRPKSAKVIRGDTHGKKRDYFEKHEIENREKYESVPNRSYDEDSYHSYSALEDNNKMTRHRIQEDMSLSELIDFEDDGGDSLIDSVPEMEYDDSTVRIFIALFDYDPNIMSPNPDAADEELPFKEGQLIKIYGEKDPDGFFMGEANGRRGFVPCNMVSEVQVDDPDIAAQLLKESNRATSSRLSSRGVSRNDSRGPPSRGPSRHNGLVRPVARSPRRSPRSSVEGSPFGPDSPRKRMVALYDYDPQELSPNFDMDVELPFKTGDHVTVFGEMDEDGFYFGEINGRRGLVPSNFLQEISQNYPAGRQRVDPRYHHPQGGPPRPRSREQHHRYREPPRDQREYPRDQRDISRDQRDYPRDQRELPREQRELPRDQRDYPRDQKELSRDQRDLSRDPRNLTRDQRDYPQDQRDFTREHPRDQHREMREQSRDQRDHSRDSRDLREIRTPDSDQTNPEKVRERKSTGGWQNYTDDVIAAKRLKQQAVDNKQMTKQQSMDTKVLNNKTLTRQQSVDNKPLTLTNTKSSSIEDKTTKPEKKRGLFYKGKNIWKKIAK